MGEIVIKKADITKMDVDAVVNPSNSFGEMGGGVALAIKKAGGDVIEKEAKKKSPVELGQAVITGAGKLKARHVIHAPTMKFPAEKIGVENVRMATRAAMETAVKNKIKTIAFPGMGTGVGGVPYTSALKVMLEEIHEKLPCFREVYIVGIDDDFVRSSERAKNI